jgi:hypothetical protein
MSPFRSGRLPSREIYQKGQNISYANRKYKILYLVTTNEHESNSRNKKTSKQTNKQKGVPRLSLILFTFRLENSLFDRGTGTPVRAIYDEFM